MISFLRHIKPFRVSFFLMANFSICISPRNHSPCFLIAVSLEKENHYRASYRILVFVFFFYHNDVYFVNAIRRVEHRATSTSNFIPRAHDTKKYTHVKKKGYIDVSYVTQYSLSKYI